MATIARHRLPDADFGSLVETVKARHRISDVVGKWTKLERAGREMVGLCLFHEERSPSMRVNDAKGKVYCFGCGASGDIIKVVQTMTGLGFMEALRWIDDAALQEVDDAERVRARAADEAARAQDVADARAFWTAAVDPQGTPAETYLREVRRIAAPLPPAVRFGRVPAWRDKRTGEWGRPSPAALFAVHDRAGEVVGLQRVFVREDGRGKANMRRPKQSLGAIKGGAVRLGPPRSTVIVCEGPEDGLSLAQELPGESVWVALGTGLMPAIEYPSEVGEVVIAAQNDTAAAEATKRAEVALLDQGFAVRVMRPASGFKDWNDQLRGKLQCR